ncbi:hypothetical protein ACROYT_G024946 [Oculina patagonica]
MSTVTRQMLKGHARLFEKARVCWMRARAVSQISSADNYALYFREKGVTDYSNIWGMPSMTEFTVCFWMKSTETKGTPFSYATDTQRTVMMWWCCSIRRPLNSSLVTLATQCSWNPRFFCHRQTSVSANDGNWHHICATWKNTGAWKFYKDGSLAQSGAGFQTGYTVKGGGSLILGQEQDSTGGGLDATQSLKGMLTNVNVWNRALTSCEIEALSTNSCLAGEGNVYKWADFIYGVKGNTAVVIPSPCSP